MQGADAEAAVRLVEQFEQRVVSADYMRRFLSNPSNFLLAAEEEGAVIGFLSAHQIDSLSREAQAMFIYEIEVSEEHRRQGVGSVLIDHIRDIANERGMFEMFVFTNYSNTEARAFYAATGGQIEEGDELMFVYPLAKG